MRSQPQDRSHRPRVKDEFKKSLPSWTRPVACQNECSPPEVCSCHREIVNVKAIEEWWNEQLTDNQTRGHIFLGQMSSTSHRTFPPAYQNIFTGEERCVRVLSLLLHQDHDDLIDLFYSGAMHDKYLMRGSSDEVLRKTLLEKMKPEDVDAIVEDFHRDKWAYCPMELSLGMAFNAHRTRAIPPFCHKIKLPDKGGTASIYWVAVQKDLISDHALASTLSDSLYPDETYGECYQMILKTYSGDKKSVFEFEKQAFAGLNSKNDVPILQYLGSYTHDYGEGREMETYNILLEYGDNDLYQAWADETNVPPVRAQEILRTWNSLFEIAKAIRHVHNPVVQRGGGSDPLRFHGWHADIKPDNILSIRGKLKLSDFGFSSFAPVVEGLAHSNPTDIIRGFTDTYGAPEVFHMKRADGTLSGVTQSIDMWSFGCVLSVAATWIVLGFQGIRQYEQLRQLAPSNCQGKTKYDRFHDGTKVLREIRKWHNYLRGHLRPSDTTTEQVLTLIENKLLNEDPSERPDSKMLCKELQDIYNRAQDGIQRLPQHTKKTDASVLEALSKIEERAHNQRAPEAKMSTGLLPQPIMPTGAGQVNPPQWASMQFQKDDMINNKPLGQTPYRKEILRQELGKTTPDLHGRDEHASYNVHDGEFTQSPAHSTSIQDFRIPIPQPISVKTQFLEADQEDRDKHYRAVDNEVSVPDATLKTPKPQQRHNEYQDDSQRVWTAFSNPYRMPDSWQPGHTLANSPDVAFHTLSQARNDDNVQSSIAELASPSSIESTYGGKQIYNPISPVELHPSITSNSNPASLLAPFQSPTESVYANYPDTQVRLKPAVEHQGPAMPHDSPHMSPELPLSVLDLPYSICKKRKELDQEKLGTFWRLKNMVKGKDKEDRRMDPNLKDISSDLRELVFIIDNGWTMFEHWPILTFVVETLAMNAAGVDKSGIDLRFTVDGDGHNKNDIVGDAGRRLLKRTLTEACPESKKQKNVTTDMVTVFQKVYKEWGDKKKPATTLYIFTDGKWAHENPTALGERILKFAEQDNRGTGKRHFSIQLIRFGDNEADKAQLQWLDDSLCSSLNLRDIIDHCSWRASVDKIFKGSIDGFYDEGVDEEEEESPITSNYKELAKKFTKFNRGEEIQEDGGQSAGLLSPSTSSLRRRSPSQLSGRSSMSAPGKQDTIPPETPKRHSKRLSRSSFFSS